MAETENNEIIDNPTPESAPASREPRRYAWLAVLSLLGCIAAWVGATVSGFCALVAGALSILAGAFALGSRRSAVRNTAITSIIAAAVLVIVVGVFMLVLHKLLA